MTPAHEIVRRVAAVLRAEVAPATAGALPRSQAFRASAVLHRVARELELAESHVAAEEKDRRRLRSDDVWTLLAGTEAPATRAAVAALEDAEDHKAALARLVSALYSDRDRLPDTTFEPALARVRQALRADLDRDLDVAG